MLLGILADVHEDIIRLEESLETFKSRNVDEIICLGDIVGFCVPYYSYLKTRDSNKVVKLTESGRDFRKDLFTKQISADFYKHICFTYE